MIRYMCCDSPIGKLVVCEESDRLVAIRLNEIPIGAVPEETSVGKEACSQFAQVAEAVGSPKAVRAVGGACHDNPWLIVVPCHRVVGSSGQLTGYAAGLDTKRFLLEYEGGRLE